ncbi:MAG: Holliday junction branch migration protein RuvA [Pseudomonadota bacterium]|nr:Holliday junction branch migration protein RuvA [Pseudomonadota bacterium]
MIGWLNGVLVEKDSNFCILSIGGVGYVVSLTLKDAALLPELGKSVELFVCTVYREDAQLMFGFLEKSAKLAFSELTKASGVGPKMALQILDTYDISELSLFVSQGNYLALTRVKGIGPKVAKRLVIDLKGKLTYVACPEKSMQTGASQNEAIDALIQLGYKEQQARQMVSNSEGITVEDIIKSALQKEGSKL